MVAQMSNPKFCASCGRPVEEDDKFCGSCGAAVLPPAPQAEQVVSGEVAASMVEGSVARSRGKGFLLVSVVLVLLMGGGALAYLGTGFGSASAPPDPAFDLPLQALDNLTDAPVMLPAELPSEFKNVGVGGNLEGESYGVVFLANPPDDLVGTWPRSEIVGTLQAVPEAEYEPDPSRKAASTEAVRLPDGTEAQLRYMEPVGEAANYGPQWEGKFDKDGYSYTLSTSLGRDGKTILTEALSSMVAVEL